MKMGKIAFVLAAFVVILAMGCGSTPPPGTEVTSARDAASVVVRWDNDDAGTLTVNNDVTDDLILFAGSINNRNILGGVRQVASRRIDFFNRVSEDSGTFLLRAVKESTYREKGSNLNSDDIIFASLVIFDKSNARPITINIQRYVGGNAVVVMQNDTNMALQIRLDRPDGPVITTLAPLERNKRVFMDPNPMGYTFYPVYQFYDRTTMGIRSIMPNSVAEGRQMNPQVPRPGQPIPTITWDASIPSMFSPFATLLVSNETDRGAFMLQGSGRMTSQTGNIMFNPGIETFELNLQRQQSLVIGGLSVDLGLGQANLIRIPDYTYEAETSYQIRIRQGAAPTITPMGRSDTSSLRLELLNE
jgi:hypothetical protein